MFDQHADFLGADGEIHGTTDTRRKPRIVCRPIRKITLLGYLEGAEQCQIQMAAADHQKRIRVMDIAAAGHQRDRLLAGIDQIPIDLVVGGGRADPQDAVLAV